MDAAALGDPAEPALIGVSGGPDSIALLHSLATAGFQNLLVCHLDHGWRPESAEEARFVCETASRLGYETVVERADLSAAEGSLEAAAREARYAFFARVAATRGVSRVLLAHHADDQVETFLFNLLRGAGGPGLSGMQPISRRVIDGTPLTLLRPLLACWREEIDAYLHAHQLEYRIDPSNSDTRHTRNRLRHEILPALAEAFGRPVRGALWKAAAILSAENEFIGAQPELQDVPAELDVRKVRALPLAVQRRLIHSWLQKHAISAIGFDEVESVRALVNSTRPAKVNLPGGYHARRRSARVFIEKATIGSGARSK